MTSQQAVMLLLCWENSFTIDAAWNTAIQRDKQCADTCFGEKLLWLTSSVCPHAMMHSGVIWGA